MKASLLAVCILVAPLVAYSGSLNGPVYPVSEMSVVFNPGMASDQFSVSGPDVAVSGGSTVNDFLQDVPAGTPMALSLFYLGDGAFLTGTLTGSAFSAGVCGASGDYRLATAAVTLPSFSGVNPNPLTVTTDATLNAGLITTQTPDCFSTQPFTYFYAGERTGTIALTFVGSGTADIWQLDSATFTSVPEPASIFIAGLAAVWLALRSRSGRPHGPKAG